MTEHRIHAVDNDPREVDLVAVRLAQTADAVDRALAKVAQAEQRVEQAKEALEQAEIAHSLMVARMGQEGN